MRALLLLLAFTVQGRTYESFLVRHKPSCTYEQAKAFHLQQGYPCGMYKHLKWSWVRGESQAYRSSPLFDRVQSDKTYHVSETIPNDPLWSEQWGPQRIHAPLAWDIQTSNDVVVAVIDTGIDFQHEDLRDNLWTGPSGEHGYRCMFGSVTPGGMDDHGHGTHVAGIIGAAGNNGVGIAGLNWRTKLMAMKFLNASGFGFSSDAANAFEKLVDLKRSGVNVRVANCSWGSLGEDPFLQEVFQFAEDEGIIQVCAAGNSGLNIDADTVTPAAFTNSGCVSVVASDEQDGVAFFSNYGLASTDVLAPGNDILSCLLHGGFEYLSGTSMAAPHVSGVLAMMLARNPSLTPAQARNVLLDPESNDPTPFVSTTTWGGRLNMFKALANPTLTNPPVNHVPTLSGPSKRLGLAPRSTVSLSVKASDPDNDPLRFSSLSTSKTDDAWLVNFMLGNLYSSSTTNPAITLSNQGAVVDMLVPVTFATSDGKGGSALTRSEVFAWRDTNQFRPIHATFTATPYNDAVLYQVAATNSEVRYAITSSRSDGGGLFGCCLTPNTPLIDGVATQGANLWRAHVMDPHGNFTNLPPVVFYVDSTSFEVPIARVTFSTTRGHAPLNVEADMRASGTNWYYFASSGNLFSSDFQNATNPIKRFTLTNLGINTVFFSVQDRTNGLFDSYVQLFSVLPPLKLEPRLEGDTFKFPFLTEPGVLYDVQRTQLLPPQWETFTAVLGNGSYATISDTASTRSFYRVVVK